MPHFIAVPFLAVKVISRLSLSLCYLKLATQPKKSPQKYPLLWAETVYLISPSSNTAILLFVKIRSKP